MQMHFFCWSLWDAKGMKTTVDARQKPICLSKLPYVVGLNLLHCI
jgi:hypothetical protein